MKRYIVCLLLCVLCLHACASRPQPSVQPQASVKTTTTATTTSTTQPAVLEVYHAVTMTETETDVPVQTVSRAAETSQQAETVTTAAPRTTAAVSETSKAAETTTKRTHLLKMPEHVTQTTAAKTTAAASSASSTATTKTVTTTAATTTTAYKGGSVVPLQTVPSGTAAQASYCTITISCGEIRDNPDKLKKPEKLAFVPQDGYILHNLTVSFTPGETVYDVLRRVCETHVCASGCTFCTKDGKIQMESSFTPVYDSYYVEGIHQIYEKDCGGTSGWTYYVNGTFPHVGSSQYTLSSGDRVEWVFSIEKDGIE